LFAEWKYFLVALFCFAEIPENDYIKYFAPEFSLKIPNGQIVCIYLLGFLFGIEFNLIGDFFLPFNVSNFIGLD